jgi:hypothetical protein
LSFLLLSFSEESLSYELHKGLQYLKPNQIDQLLQQRCLQFQQVCLLDLIRFY